MRSSRRIIVTSLVLVGAAVILVATSIRGPVYETAEFQFSYPSEWKRIENVRFPNAEALGDSSVGAHTVGVDQDNWVTVVMTPVRFEVTLRNVSEVASVAREQYEELLEPAGVRFMERAYAVEDAGLPGIRLRVKLESRRGVWVEEQITTLYRDSTSYTISCQSRGEHVREMTAGCDRVFETFRAK